MTAPSMSASCATRRSRDRLILLDGWSKTYAMTGWRMGYGVWPKALFAHAERLAINCHSCVNAATQYAGIAALEGPREPVHRMVQAFAERREFIVAALNGLPGIRCATPGGAFYTFPNIAGTGFDARTLPERAARRARVWRPSPAPALANSARAICASPTPTASRRSPRRSSASASFLGNLPRSDAAEG